MSEPCMCGARDCSVCGHLQGYSKCRSCGSLECEACDECRAWGECSKCDCEEPSND